MMCLVSVFCCFIHLSNFVYLVILYIYHSDRLVRHIVEFKKNNNIKITNSKLCKLLYTVNFVNCYIQEMFVHYWRFDLNCIASLKIVLPLWILQNYLDEGLIFRGYVGKNWNHVHSCKPTLFFVFMNSTFLTLFFHVILYRNSKVSMNDI